MDSSTRPLVTTTPDSQQTQTSQSQENAYLFYIGEVVRLTAGGPAMTVAATTATNRVSCWWFTTEGKLQREDLLANTLVRVEPDKVLMAPKALQPTHFAKLVDSAPRELQELIDRLIVENPAGTKIKLEAMDNYAREFAPQYWKLSVQGFELDLGACFESQSIRVANLVSIKVEPGVIEPLVFMLEVRPHWDLKQTPKSTPI